MDEPDGMDAKSHGGLSGGILISDERVRAITGTHAGNCRGYAGRGGGDVRQQCRLRDGGCDRY
jgi:hypothetical protein